MSAERHYDVLIIGGGPAGAILASLLGQHNYRTLSVELGTSDIQKNIIAARLGL